ncbi:SDR family NAD(P)-dependent oxidoreductase [Rhizobium tumorigenes]|uniref:SDR family NAD(P)-dependent oxidoreductase n=1 Tax=Rhizobium tumorigenes TaxID=2041385 RepID=A0AAF1KJ86_9HYPH|nr:SDR family NAD(P)-dependent oxidoreductase [Rhizobium tumorigenes]WFR98807.1 SDR family NAD(P)-dependent oxidoreductase [Rhizobium tumorigenes]
MYMNRTRVDGSIAFVTGGGRGIGLSTAEALAEAGARVVISGQDEAALQQAVEKLKSGGYDARYVVLDITQSDACTEASERINRDVGPVDILIANAGIAWPDTAAEDMSDASWTRVIDVNLNGTFWTCRAFGKPMLERGKGSIVTVGSMSGMISNKPQRQAHYNASKAGLHHLTKSLAGEWATRNVRVNCVAPGYVNTAMSNISFLDPKNSGPWMAGTPMDRLIEPEEVASANLFLASPASSGMTGTILTIDAGYTIW